MPVSAGLVRHSTVPEGRRCHIRRGVHHRQGVRSGAQPHPESPNRRGKHARSRSETPEGVRNGAPPHPERPERLGKRAQPPSETPDGVGNGARPHPGTSEAVGKAARGFPGSPGDVKLPYRDTGSVSVFDDTGCTHVSNRGGRGVESPADRLTAGGGASPPHTAG